MLIVIEKWRLFNLKFVRLLKQMYLDLINLLLDFLFLDCIIINFLNETLVFIVHICSNLFTIFKISKFNKNNYMKK